MRDLTDRQRKGTLARQTANTSASKANITTAPAYILQGFIEPWRCADTVGTDRQSTEHHRQHRRVVHPVQGGVGSQPVGQQHAAFKE